MALRGEYWWVRPHGGGLDWARCMSGEEAPRQEGGCREWSELPAPSGARLMLCVPGERVRVHTVRLPAGSRRRFRAALPFALEDQLLRDPEEYHFVPLPSPKSQPETPVAVVERRFMDQWLEGLEEHGWRPRVMVPEFLAVPAPEPGRWFLDLAESPFLLRIPRGGGGAALSGELGTQPPGALMLALEQSKIAPAILRVRVAHREQREVLSAWQPWLDAQGLDLEVQEDGRKRSAWLARQPQPESGCNLLTGPYASREDPWVWARRLAPAAGLALGLLAVAGAQWTLEGRRIRAEHQRLESAIESTYRKAFPGAKNLVDPRYQMEQRLKRLQRNREEPSEQEGSLLDRMAGFAEVVSGGSGQLRLKALVYTQGNLELEVSVADYEALERLQRQLSAKGAVEVEKAELKEGRVQARLRLREAG
ncbi:type II secretion system protein GspL [Thiohalorhabdus methylotrophus]|uniref:Type II secretion system protein L n=1 Tax=Thiohalorhabdus methylotrophus TaxID=3242694 RepID=A0ABV4TXJ7_9GAMM